MDIIKGCVKIKPQYARYNHCFATDYKELKINIQQLEGLSRQYKYLELYLDICLPNKGWNKIPKPIHLSSTKNM